MPIKDLTDRFISTAQPESGRQTDYFDSIVKGLCLTASAGGAKTFFLHFTRQTDGKRARVKLGRYPEITLAKARQKAREARAAIGEGADPVAEKAARAASISVRDLVESYIARHAMTQRSGAEIARRLRKNVSEVVGDLKLSALHRRDLTKCVDAVMDRGASTEANRLFEDVRAMVRWARGRGDLDENLVEGMQRPAELVPRDRVLSVEEMRVFWNDLPRAKMQEGTRNILRLCLVTAQRVGEVAGMRREELDLANLVWRIPASRSKNKHDHVVPISALALSIVENQISVIPANCPWIFPSPAGAAPITNFAVAKAVGRYLTTSRSARFTPHDLRRTAATQIEELGVSPFLIGHVLNHLSVTRASVTSKVYARHSYDSEKRDAHDLWATRLSVIVELV